MTYTIRDNNGNMICSIENVDPVRSNKSFNFKDFGGLSLKQFEQLKYNEKYKKYKDIISYFIKNKAVIENKMNEVKFPESDLLNDIEYNQKFKTDKYKINKNEIVDNNVCKILSKNTKDIKYLISNEIFINKHYPIMVSLDKNDEKEVSSITSGEFFKEYEDKNYNILQDAIKSLIGSNTDSGINIKIKNRSKFDSKFKIGKSFRYLYFIGFSIEFSFTVTSKDLDSTKVIAAGNDCDKILEYLWDFHNSVSVILKDIKTKSSFENNRLRITKKDFIYNFRPIITEYLKKHETVINARELLLFMSKTNHSYYYYDLTRVHLEYKDNNDISNSIMTNLNKIIKPYKKYFEITIDNNRGNEVDMIIYPKTNIINL